MPERKPIAGKTDDGHRVVVGATPWQRLVLSSSNSRGGPWRAMVYALFSIAFGLCDVAEAIRDASTSATTQKRDGA